MEINDSFPTIGKNHGVTSVASTKLQNDMHGITGVVAIGSGKAHTLMFFGATGLTGTPYTVVQSDPYTWKPGDTVVVFDGTHTDTFTYVASGYVLGAKNFTTKAHLMAEVDGVFGPVTGTFPAAFNTITTTDKDALNYGLIKFAATAIGTAGNSMTVTVTTKSETCGVMLSSTFRGGAATAIKTVVWSPLAAAYRPLLALPGNAAAQTLYKANPFFCTQTLNTDVFAGVCYIITHDAAAGTESILFSIGDG